MDRASAARSQVVGRVADELPVTASATTSRALIDNDVVRVVAFTFDTGEQLTEHTAAMPVVVQVLRGDLRFQVGDESHSLTAGDCVYLAAGASHALEALSPSLVSLVMVRGS